MPFFSRIGGTVAACIAALALSACAGYPQAGYGQPGGYPAAGYPQGGYSSAPQPYPSGGYVQYGRVTNVQLVQVQQPDGIGGTGIGAGAVVGGVVGGVLGRQVGKGTGRDLATIAGVVGGAMAGNAIQKGGGQANVRDVYRVTVQMGDGGSRVFDYADNPQLRIGEQVRVENNQLFR